MRLLKHAPPSMTPARVLAEPTSSPRPTTGGRSHHEAHPHHRHPFRRAGPAALRARPAGAARCGHRRHQPASCRRGARGRHGRSHPLGRGGSLPQLLAQHARPARALRRPGRQPRPARSLPRRAVGRAARRQRLRAGLARHVARPAAVSRHARRDEPRRPAVRAAPRLVRPRACRRRRPTGRSISSCTIRRSRSACTRWTASHWPSGPRSPKSSSRTRPASAICSSATCTGRSREAGWASRSRRCAAPTTRSGSTCRRRHRTWRATSRRPTPSCSSASETVVVHTHDYLDTSPRFPFTSPDVDDRTYMLGPIRAVTRSCPQNRRHRHVISTWHRQRHREGRLGSGRDRYRRQWGSRRRARPVVRARERRGRAARWRRGLCAAAAVAASRSRCSPTARCCRWPGTACT